MTPTEKQIEAAARAIVASKSPELANGEWWSKNVQHFREMCAEFPAYAASHSLVTDAFRHAETALTAALAVEAGTDDNQRMSDEQTLIQKQEAIIATLDAALTTSPASSGVEGEAVALPETPDWPFRFGDQVRKHSGAWWEGRVVGYYSTAATPIGYCVQLATPAHNGPVQIYPLSALSAAPSLSAGAGGEERA